MGLDQELLDNYTLEDLDEESILEYKEIIHKQNLFKRYNKMNDLSFLTELGVFKVDRNDNRKRKLTLGGLLFLGKEEAIKSKLSHFHLDYFDKRFNNNCWADRVSTGDLNYPNLNLFKYYKIVYKKLENTISSFKENDFFDEKIIADLKEVIREALVNTLIHAEYVESNISIRVCVSKFCYSFQNPGSMQISQNQFFMGGKSRPRNNTLVRYFRQMGLSKRAGVGGEDIFRLIRRNNFKLPKIESEEKNTALRLWIKRIEDCYLDLSNKERDVYFIIANSAYISKKAIMVLSEYEKEEIKRILEGLLEKKYIEKEKIHGKNRYYKNFNKLEN